MATVVKLPEKAEATIHYDKEVDVLYISFGKPHKAEEIDIGEGTMLRVDPETGQVVGITILDFNKGLQGNSTCISQRDLIPPCRKLKQSYRLTAGKRHGQETYS